MCSGVMIITVTIAACAQAIATTAAPTAGTSRTVAVKRDHDLVGVLGRGDGCGGLGEEQRVGPEAYGDPAGRHHERDRADREPAGELGDPERSGDGAAARRSGWGRRPLRSVVAHTTTDSARARVASGARSVAA